MLAVFSGSIKSHWSKMWEVSVLLRHNDHSNWLGARSLSANFMIPASLGKQRDSWKRACFQVITAAEMSLTDIKRWVNECMKHTPTLHVYCIFMSLFELGCSTWELIISRNIPNYCDQQNWMFQLRKQSCSMWSLYRHLKGVLTTPLRPLRPLKNPHWMTELYWSGLGNWVNQFLGQFVQYKDLNGTWFTPFPNLILINKVQSHLVGGFRLRQSLLGVLEVSVFKTPDIWSLVGNMSLSQRNIPH